MSPIKCPVMDRKGPYYPQKSIEDTPLLQAVRGIENPYGYAYFSAETFMNKVTDPDKDVSIDDLFSMKLERAEDRMMLVIAELLVIAFKFVYLVHRRLKPLQLPLIGIANDIEYPLEHPQPLLEHRSHG